jgi:hypothetical protein
MIISKSYPKEFTNTFSRNIIKINEWFKSNSLSLNIDKTYFVQFCTKTNQNMMFKLLMKIDKLQKLKI